MTDSLTEDFYNCHKAGGSEGRTGGTKGKGGGGKGAAKGRKGLQGNVGFPKFSGVRKGAPMARGGNISGNIRGRKETFKLVRQGRKTVVELYPKGHPLNHINPTRAEFKAEIAFQKGQRAYDRKNKK